MLLDQKRTKRLVKVSAVVTALAFGGIALIVVLAIFFGIGAGGAGDPAKERVTQARERVDRQPDNAAAWDQLATAQYTAGDTDGAITSSKRAIALAPHDFSRTQTLSQIYSDSNRHQQAMNVINDFIEKNPDSAEAYLQLGGAAEAAGKPQVARLSYEKFLQLDPQNPSAGQVRERLKTLAPGAAAAPTR